MRVRFWLGPAVLVLIVVVGALFFQFDGTRDYLELKAQLEAERRWAEEYCADAVDERGRALRASWTTGGGLACFGPSNDEAEAIVPFPKEWD